MITNSPQTNIKWILTSVAFLFILACQQKTVEDVYKDQKVRVDLSATPVMGYAPLEVDFSAYLETKTLTVEREIGEVKWLITGPGNFRREIIQSSENYMDDPDHNKEGFFYMNYVFGVPGKYRVKLLLNDGEFGSKTVLITARDKGTPNRRRY